MIARRNYRAVEAHLREFLRELQNGIEVAKKSGYSHQLIEDWREREQIVEGLADRMKREAEAPACKACGDTGEVELITAPGTAPCGCPAGQTDGSH